MVKNEKYGTLSIKDARIETCNWKYPYVVNKDMLSVQWSSKYKAIHCA